MATQKDVLDRKKDVTDRISTQVRTLSLGVLVYVWGVMGASPGTLAATLARQFPVTLLCMALFAVLALATDYLHYFFATIVVDDVLHNPKSKETGVYDFHSRKWSYRAQQAAYWSKQLWCILAVLALLTMVLAAVAHGVLG